VMLLDAPVMDTRVGRLYALFAANSVQRIASLEYNCKEKRWAHLSSTGHHCHLSDPFR
jgi:hypothetical protein